MRKYSYFYEGIYEKKLGIMRRGVAQKKEKKGADRLKFTDIWIGTFLVLKLDLIGIPR